MAKKKKKGITTLSLVLVLVMIVGAALSFTGLFLDWTSTDGTGLGALVSGKITLQEWADINDTAEVEYFMLTNIFAWITAAATAVAAVLFIVKLVVRLRLLGTLGGVAGIVALVCGVLAIVFTFMMGSNYGLDAGFIGTSSTTPAVGCYLLTVGGVLGGAAAIGGAVKS